MFGKTYNEKIGIGDIDTGIRIMKNYSCADREYFTARREFYSSPPTKSDYGKTMSLFHDFGINVRDITIPDFKTRNQLYNWRTNYIKEHL